VRRQFYFIADSVPTLGEEADLEAQTFSLAQKLIESTNVQFSTNPLFCQTCVMPSFFFTVNFKQLNNK
jgi:hypothetical protein